LGDADLLRLSAHGDEEAFVILYRRHQGPVFRYSLHMSGSRATAEEVTQDVFLALLAGLRRYAQERGPLQPYLIGMARNQVRRYLAQAAATAQPAPCDQQQLLNEITAGQELAALRAAILKLPPNYREVVVLCDLEGLEYAQAAAHLGCPVGTVRSRLHRARAILEARLRSRERCPV
jgi:RNA polymerase sigma-70 factor (ECF subfamily)